MTLIKVNDPYLKDDLLRSLKFFRNNPSLAAKYLLRRDGEPLELMPVQSLILNEWWNKPTNILTASRGAGKANVHGTKVLTPSGWKYIENLNINDKVITPDNKQSNIIAVHPQGEVKTYNISFSTGSKCCCSRDHLWTILIYYSNQEWITVDTYNLKTIVESGFKVRIPVVDSEIHKYKTSFIEVTAVEESSSKKCTCITIEDTSGLYIIDDYIVTHNSFLSAVYSSLKCVLYPSQMIGCFGPSFRQAKLIFNEFNLICEESPLLQECITKMPTVSNDQAVCIFKSAGHNIRPSSIKALPVGNDGKKIRGNRFTEFFLDECVQLPESIFRSVIRPMISTDINPAKSVKRIKELKKLYGDDIPEDMIDISANGYTVITSGYYQFNYWWEEIVRAWEKIQAGSKDHSLRFVPYYDLPEGFMKMSVVNQSKENDPSHVFLTEWCAEWIADSEGAFPMSLLESARDATVIPKFSRDKDSDKGKQYIFGIDVARDRDSTAIVVIELGDPSKLVHIVELEQQTFPKQAKQIFELVYRFEPIRIFMDTFGGGKTLKDLLEAPETVGMPSSMKLISVDEGIYAKGRRIIHMCVPSPEFLEDANNATKTLLEQRALKLPTAVNPIESVRKKGGATIDLVQELINQVASVVITPTGITGRLRYDLPKNQGSVQGADIQLNAKKKDLYSAFVFAGYGVYELAYRPIEDQKMLAQGVIKEIPRQDFSVKKSATGQNLGRYTISNSDNIGVGSKTSNKQIVIPGGGVIITRR